MNDKIADQRGRDVQIPGRSSLMALAFMRGVRAGAEQPATADSEDAAYEAFRQWVLSDE